MSVTQADRAQGIAGGLAIKAPARAATVAPIVLSGLLTIDGVALAAGNRVLVKNQADQTTNGVYVVGAGAWTRDFDFDDNRDLVKGTLTLITDGAINAGLVYELTSANPIVIGTSNLTFVVYNVGSSISYPIAATLGGTGGGSAISGLANLGLVQVTSPGGTANAQTGTIDALVTAFRADQLFEYTPVVTNTSAVTLALTPSGGGALPAKNIFVNGAACVGGELIVGVPVLLHYDGTRLNIISNLANPTSLTKAIYGFTYANNGTDNLDIAAGGAMDVGGTTWITGTALTKQTNVAWAVGNAAGMLDTGAVGNNDYYLWVIARSDTRVVDYLSSLSSTTPTMPASYDSKRLIGWFKRAGGIVVAFHTYEGPGGSLDFAWDAPTADVNLLATLTTTRRTDAVKVPLNFAVMAHLNIAILDAAVGSAAIFYCPDQTDLVPDNAAFLNLTSLTTQVAAVYQSGAFRIRTSALGLIAARANIATMDVYRASTLGFNWARR